MVGHLEVPGLTEPGLPATLSPAAYRYLRKRHGASAVVMTDSLSMGAITSGQRLTPARAAVRALRAGADTVLIDPGAGPGGWSTRSPPPSAPAATRARPAVASARRVLAMKRLLHAPLPLSSLAPPGGTTGASLTPTLSAVARDRLGQPMTVRVLVRRAGSTRWDVVNGAQVRVAHGARAAYRIPAGRLAPARTYEWQARACPVSAPPGARCSPPTPVLRFTTRDAPVPPPASASPTASPAASTASPTASPTAAPPPPSRRPRHLRPAPCCSPRPGPPTPGRSSAADR
jgi:hypothetical protein